MIWRLQPSSLPCTRQAPRCRPYYRTGPSKRQTRPSMKPSPSGLHLEARTLRRAPTASSRGHGTMRYAPRGLLDRCSAPTSLTVLSCSPLLHLLLASVAPASGSWLNALPCTNLRLGNEELRITAQTDGGPVLPCVEKRQRKQVLLVNARRRD